MSHRDDCPDRWEARREGRRAADYGRSSYSNPYREQCDEAAREWDYAYRRREEERREERIEEERRDYEARRAYEAQVEYERFLEEERFSQWGEPAQSEPAQEEPPQ